MRLFKNESSILKSTFLACALLLGLSMSFQANAFRVLFIGNSFTGFSKPSLEQFRRASPLEEDKFGYVFVGGRSLDYHVNQAATVDIIRNGNWDYVVLQDHSKQTLFFLDLFNSAVRELAGIIRESGAEPVLFQTWARLENGNYSLRQQEVNRQYNRLASELGIHVMNVGEVWLSIYNTNRSYFNRLYQSDGIHQTPLGATIVAAAAYKVMYDTDLSWAPMEATARRAVLDNVSTLEVTDSKLIAAVQAMMSLLLD